MDGQPVRYRRSDTGGYLLWSVGANRIDDGARADPKAGTIQLVVFSAAQRIWPMCEARGARILKRNT
jgi:hypothetical protein